MWIWMSLIFISGLSTVCNYTEDTYEVIYNLQCMSLMDIRVDIGIRFTD